MFNGEKYLCEQIDSILNQTVSDIKIVIRDDGSTDSSPEIIAGYAGRFPDKISVITGTPTGSASANFGELLKNCDDDYIMFADQDDVWYEDKVQTTLDAMLKAENGEPQRPVLVHTDLSVSDAGLKIISGSLFEYQKIMPDDLSLNRLLVQNYVTGCTVMINRALKNKALPIPSGAAMHDWWLALTAAAFGIIVTVKKSTMYYRQHGENEVGAKAGGGLGFIVRKLKTIGSVKRNIEATYRQAELFLKAYGDTLPEDMRDMLAVYVSMKNVSKIKKIRLINRYNFKKGTKLRVFGQYILG